uniref:ATP-dependent DNA helicase n=1 Tax=Setaria italica TaxID=4555 RepID=K3ZNT6_SETIT
VSYPDRSYYDTADYECAFCSCMFWYGERSKQDSTQHHMIYNLCCRGGKVFLPSFQVMPEFLASLEHCDRDSRCKNFLNRIRQYNSLFAFTSMGANMDKGINDGAGPYMFKINGLVYHRIGPLMPAEDESPKFAQLYIYEIEHEIRNRISAIVSEDSDDTNLDPDIVNAIQKARDLLAQHGGEHIGIRIVGAHEDDPFQFNVATTSEIAGLVVGDFSLENYKRDIIVDSIPCSLQHISCLHPAYMALQYPLLFPYGEQDFCLGIPYRYQPNPYLCCGRLSFQSSVDIFACIEECRLTWIADHQDDFRCEHFQGITDAVSRGCIDGTSIGKERVVSVSFVGESVELECGQQHSDRPDVGCRVYHMKLSKLMDDIKSGSVFGPIVAVLQSVEFQKRGLPHAHILVWLQDIAVADIISIIDKYISAEIPDPEEDPLGYALVEEFMMHGPCGDDNKNSPCMKNGSCSKHFPKQFQAETTTDGIGFIMYKRHDKGRYIIKNGVKLDNRYVVPYNMFLLKKYQAHINVEFCNQTGKRKASSSSTFLEAYWRIFCFKLHHKIPAIERLAVHLPNMNMAPYATGANLASLIATPFFQKTTLTEWFVANRNYPAAHDLSYCDFPTRGNGTYKIGRMYNIHPSPGENYYLRMLLLLPKGAQCYEDVRMVDGILYDTCWRSMADDIEYFFQKCMGSSSYFVPDSQLRGFGNRLIHDEDAYDIATLVDQAPLLYSRLNDFQRTAYDSIVRSVMNNEPAFYFMSGFGGTGKTFLWNSIITYVRSLGKIVLVVASSGVASLLLLDGRISHSRFKIPIDIDETRICDIKRGTMLADLVKKGSLIIWDEALMTHRRCFEALDHSLRDIMSKNDADMGSLPFSGMVVVLGGDLR